MQSTRVIKSGLIAGGDDVGGRWSVRHLDPLAIAIN